MEKGLILVNTGPGKGKTSAALGVSLRALGHGYNVGILQFIKSQTSGESLFFERYAAANPPIQKFRENENGGLFYKKLGLGFVFDTPSEADKMKAIEALAEAKKLLSENFHLVVLDEICVAMDKGMLDVNEVIDILKNRNPAINVVLTGRGCPEEIIAIADTVTIMEVRKHAYEKGIKARQGVEF